MSPPDLARAAAPAARATPDVQSLLALGDEAFVRQAYLLLLGREADEGGLDNYLARVRSGDHKARLLVQLALSDEGRQRHVKVPGIDALIAEHAVRPVPLVQRVVRKLLRPLRGPSQEPLEQSMRAIDNRLYRMEQLLVEHNAALAAVAEQLAQLPLHGGTASLAQRRGTGAASANHQAPPARQTPPRADHLYRRLARMLARRAGS